MDTPADTWDNLHAHLTFLWLNRFYLYSCAAFGISLWFCFQFLNKAKEQNKNRLAEFRIPKITAAEKEQQDPSLQKVHVAGVKVFYGSQTGTAKRFALVLTEAVASINLPAEIINMEDYDPDDSLIDEISSQNICVFLVATYTDGKPTANAAWFCKWLEETANDFRVGKAYLKGLRYAVFGLGNSVYADHFNTVSRNLDKWLWMLGARRILSCALGDSNVVKSQHGSIEADFEAWKAKLLTRLQALAKGDQKACSGRCKKGQCRSKSKGSQEAKEQETSKHGGKEVSGEDWCVALFLNYTVLFFRHHTNPVGTEWRWKMDRPEMILQEAIENHQNLIKQFKGVPGVRDDRFREGMEAKHCALSLVGEPIMYPQINQFLKLLHHRNISSFLVTNAQFPEEIR
ncbi:PREDICTED: S-adenosyl-L-methionine-dependent tRNA 4-demethylwyosine synthase-like [Thamnophis sirtalis]|uniref:S-adenosyl-L-methionine-dependent tRNA 4-demethylwyosine synthase-like n=1 Tax=Thamnophis sirtalis TaxID=35019 RepID=A0A6I9XCB7_9SAUR|nr:PREDICTED: S-adenosyl-L-methionine-dependent tRNA 4-demethylwyosine synthase-like [Thamnophis sirtalis]